MALSRRLTELGVGVGTGAAGVLAHAVAATVIVAFGEPLVSDPITSPRSPRR